MKTFQVFNMSEKQKKMRENERWHERVDCLESDIGVDRYDSISLHNTTPRPL